MKPDIRTDDMAKWSITTRNCFDLDQAMDAAVNPLMREARVYLWPLKNERWLLIAQTPGFAN